MKQGIYLCIAGLLTVVTMTLYVYNYIISNHMKAPGYGISHFCMECNSSDHQHKYIHEFLFMGRPYILTPKRIIPVKSAMSKFRARFSRRERQLLLDSVQVLHVVCSTLKIEYFMGFGSLLGSYRYHNMIPWDHDFDVVIHENDRLKLKSALKRMGKVFDVQKDIMKFTFGSPWTTYLDIFSYRHFNSSHISIAFNHGKEINMVVSKEWIWPLKLQPYAGMWIPAPRHAEPFLESWYDNLDECVSYRGTSTANNSSKYTKCSDLNAFYPYVTRQVDPVEKWTEESLVFEDNILYTLKF